MRSRGKGQRGGGGQCPTGFICSDSTTIILVVFVVLAVGVVWYLQQPQQPQQQPQQQKIYVVQTDAIAAPGMGPPTQHLRPDLYPEPVQRLGAPFPQLRNRLSAGPVTQVGILTADGGSSGSAAPDRTILPLYGRELDARRNRWNYYTRTDGMNPVQVPIRVKNRICDDDTNGCEELGNDDTVHIPALGRSFTATVYRKSIFG